MTTPRHQNTLLFYMNLAQKTGYTFTKLSMILVVRVIPSINL